LQRLHRKDDNKAAKRILNSDKICSSYSDLNFGVTFLEHSVVSYKIFNVFVSKNRYIDTDRSLPIIGWCTDNRFRMS